MNDRKVANVKTNPAGFHARRIEQRRRDAFVRAANADFTALRKDPAAWEKEFAERELWDQTLLDGITLE